MKLRFTTQEYQDAAVAGIVDLFAGEGDLARRYVRQSSSSKLLDVDSVGNALPVSVEAVQGNLHAVQRRHHLPLTDDAERLSFCVEMETGTGKTYVYIKTIYELHKRYGLSKFVIVVPSVAIREGVQKFLSMSHEHFQTHYDNPPIRWFVYNSSRLGDVREFAQSTGIEVMIINIDAFRKSENIIHQRMDKMNGDRAIDLIRLVRPVVIIDEPQSVDNTPKAKEAISWLEPLATFRYSATHREKINTVYRLTPVDAYQQGLVKQIAVSSIMAMDGFGQPYLRLVGVSADNGFKARVELDVKQKSGKVARATKTLAVGADLFVASGEREIYRNWRLSDIDAAPGRECIELSGVHRLPLGQSMGDVSQQDVKRGQIRRTLEIHLDKELRLLPLGVKVLSLFFVDQVEKYRRYENGKPVSGEYAEIFAEEYARLIALDKYGPLREAFPSMADAAKAHDGYFSVDNKGRAKDTRGDTADDVSTYELIMRDKEKLLSFETPLRFIFSHSALKEGWDNPNVFQVCTLLEHSSALSARQKIGRGLRLCVNQKGERLYDWQINTLHVIASEHFAEFADNLQREIEKETGVRFGTLDIESFLHIDVPMDAAPALNIPIPETPSPEIAAPASAAKETSFADHILPTFTPTAPDAPTVGAASSEGESIVPPTPAATVKLGDEAARNLLTALQDSGVIDKKGKVTALGREQAEQGILPLPPAYQPIANPIIAQIREATRKVTIRDYDRQVTVKRRSKQFFETSPEFQAIWERIQQRTRYRVRMDEAAFMEKAAKRMAALPKMLPPRLVESNAEVDVRQTGVEAKETHVRSVALTQGATEPPNPLAIFAKELWLPKVLSRDILRRSQRIDDFLRHPERFLEESMPMLKECKASMIVDGIRYTQWAGKQYAWQEIFDKEELIAYLDANAVKSGKGVYDHVVVDNPGVERRFAEALEEDPDVKMFFKLPDGFKIDTPLGGYNPDWAVLVDTPEARRLYFVLETKGSKWDFDRRETENIKVQCGQRHFAALGEVAYDVAEDWKSAKLALTAARE